MTTTRLLAFAPTLVALLVAACSHDSKPSDGESLEGTTWVATSVAGSTPTGPELTLGFDKDGVSGYSGCNHFGGRYQRKGEQLHVTDVLTDQVACTDTSRMDQEEVFLDVLAKTQTVLVFGNKLRLTTSDGKALVFSRKP